MTDRPPISFPPFRLIAIAGDERAIDRSLDAAADVGPVGLGLMLRDPDHRPAEVERLLLYVLSLDLPANVTLVTNGVRLPGAALVQYPAAWLAEGSDTADRFGCSAHDLEEARRAERAGASWITLSPIHPTPSKPGHPGLGVETLRAVCSAVELPVFALGGITAENAAASLDAGAYGVASISLFTAAARASLRELAQTLERI